MSIKQAFCTLTQEYMTVKEVSKHDRHVEVKDHLICATPDCKARLSFISVPAKADHFRRYRSDEHTEECFYKTEEAELKKRIERTEKIAVSLDEKAIKQKITYLFNKVNNKKPRKSSSNKRKNKRTTPTTKLVAGAVAVLGDKNDTSLEEVQKTKKVSSPSVQTRQLNHLSSVDEGKMFGLHAFLNEIRKTKNGFVFELFSGKHSANLVVTEAFIRGNRDTQIAMYLTSLMTYSADCDSLISIYCLCEVGRFQKNTPTLFVNDFNMLNVTIEGKQSKPIRLDLFQAKLVRGNFK